MAKGTRTLVTGALASILAWAGAVAATAATIVVNSTAYEPSTPPDGNCTFSEAIRAAESDAAVDGCAAGNGQDVISVPAGRFVVGPDVQSKLFVVEHDLEIRGAGPDRTILDASDGEGGLVDSPDGRPVSLVIRDLTLQNGRDATVWATDVGRSGVQLTLKNVVIGRDPAHSGTGSGLACHYDALCTVKSSRIENQGDLSFGGTYGLQGGGIDVYLASVTVEDSVIRGNRAHSGGGALVRAGTLELTRTLVADNQAAAIGGGILLLQDFYQGGSSSEVRVEQSTLTGNSAPQGGGIYVTGGGLVSASNVTLSGNTADADGGAAAIGPTPFGEGQAGGTLEFESVTIADNSAALGAAVFLADPELPGFPPNVPPPFPSTVSFRDTLVDGDCYDPRKVGKYITGGGNLESPGATCRLRDKSDRMGVASLGLAPLADNGGSTPTHLPLPWSPAIDSAPRKSCPAPATDQRGVARPQDGNGDGRAFCDRGAVEVERR